MKICHVIQNTEVGGAEIALYRLLCKLQAAGVDSAVISLIGCGPIGRRIRELGVPLHTLDMRRADLRSLAGLWRLIRCLRRERPDVVQTWTYHADLLGGLAARAVAVPCVWNIRHGTLDARIDSPNTLRSAWLCARMSRQIPHRIVVNSHAAVAVHQAAGYSAARLQVIPNGYDGQQFRPSDQARIAVRHELRIDPATPLIGTAGRFHPHKGFADFVRMAALIDQQWGADDSADDASRLLARGQECAAGSWAGSPSRKPHFLMAGKGCDDTNRELGQWIEQAGLRERFHLLSSRDDMPRLFAALDAYVQTSLTEGMPNCVAEALACGVPTFVTDVGDAARLVEDRSHVVPPQAPARMAQAVLAHWRQTHEDRLLVGQRGRERILGQYSMTATAKQYLAVWRAAAGQGSPSIVRESHPDPAARRPRLMHITTVPMTQWCFLRGQNQFMAEHGFELHAVSSPGAYLEQLAERDPVVPHAIPISRSIRPWHDVVSLCRLIGLLCRVRPDIVQVSTSKAALLGGLAAWISRIPVRIYQVRGLSSESETGWRQRLYCLLERLTAAVCNSYFVNAASLRDYAHRAGILRSDQGFLAGQGMSNGVDIDRFCADRVAPAAWASRGPNAAGSGGYTEEDPVIGFVGRLTKDKGIEDLFAAWQVIRREFPRSRLLLVGPWEKESGVGDEVRRALETDERVWCPGAQQDVAPYYRAMQLLVFPTHGTEGFPNSPMEAAAMGLPVIATQVIGCVDAVVDRVTGRLIPPRDVSALIAALREYLTNPPLRQQHGQAAARRVREHFAPQKLWAEFLAEYRRMLQQAGLPLPSVPITPHARSAEHGGRASLPLGPALAAEWQRFDDSRPPDSSRAA